MVQQLRARLVNDAATKSLNAGPPSDTASAESPGE